MTRDLPNLKQLFYNLDPIKDGASVKFDHYLEQYDRVFTPLREKPIKILEIGIEKGGSLSLWNKYFVHPDTEIYGLDIVKGCKKHERGRIRVRIGDQCDHNFLTQVGEEAERFDIIIDDGGHYPEQHIKTIDSLYPYLKQEGFYIIEDLHTAYMKAFKGGLNAATFMDFCKGLIDYTTYTGTEDNFFGKYARQIKSVEFYNKLCIIQKGYLDSHKTMSPGFDSVPYPE